MTLRPPHETFVRTDTELLQLWRDMMGVGGFDRRTLWHLFLRADGRLDPVVIPVDGVPVVPEPATLGTLARAVAEAMDNARAETLAVLLSRPGPRAMSGHDRAWARALSVSYDRAVCPWPIHLATRDRVQVFAPDDLVAA